MAWELPSQPYHPEEHLQDLWDDIVFPNDQYDDLSVNNQVADAAANNLQNSIQEKNSADRNGNVNSTYSQNLQKYQYQQGVPLQNSNQQASAIPNQNQQGVQIQNRNEDQQIGAYYTNKYGPGVADKYYNSKFQRPQKVRVSELIKPLSKTISNKMDYYLSFADKVLNQVTDFATEKYNPWKKTDWTTYTQR